VCGKRHLGLVNNNSTIGTCMQEAALERDERRPTNDKVPPNVIQRMCERFEAPQPDVHLWEKNTIVVEGDILTAPGDLKLAGCGHAICFLSFVLAC
jgi:tRNA uridine 5-carbamoylmethylation protein Kti12